MSQVMQTSVEEAFRAGYRDAAAWTTDPAALADHGMLTATDEDQAWERYRKRLMPKSPVEGDAPNK